jgi:hypothetical protein
MQGSTQINALKNGLLLVLAAGASDGSYRTAPDKEIFRPSRGESTLSHILIAKVQAVPRNNT